ncbi:gas vesicle synthesis protein GvpA [Natrialba magadii ATCC 43099]|uniref:Gas vesicle protein A n=2 Tax=Natrialba magadii (strain ATCC 43099 / DSM 3394 / CCM 3739 / CIP 104546 / IAM 13178 / JCM 8861 / NBRC 102185 / NCIMB 2190 / MS3) TaxID=547559 RepID=L9V9F2_NATMM|nr:gas vesicle synthesis protein GvpA [Natrialba magadii ATCC 43099]
MRPLVGGDRLAVATEVVLRNRSESRLAMAQPQRRPDSSSLAEVLDRVLDKGVVIDIWARVSVVGIELLTVEARVVVASVDTFLHYAEEIAKIEQATAEGDLEDLEELEVEPRPESSPKSATE